MTTEPTSAPDTIVLIHTVAEDGWEAVADYALDWALKHAAERASAP